jgi:NAD(P)-dependent dehydrogenase (short-subunit alcohol dehydrogenase family)
VTSFAELHDLTGKVAAVTGGSRGIGRAIAGVLACHPGHWAEV